MEDLVCGLLLGTWSLGSTIEVSCDGTLKSKNVILLFRILRASREGKKLGSGTVAWK